MPHIHELYDYTVSFFILHPIESKVCLHYHRKLKSWTQLGGHVELDEDPMQALERELLEEAGLKKDDFTIVETQARPHPRGIESLPIPFSLLIYKYGKTKHKHIDLPYVIKSKKTSLNPMEGESTQIDWFDQGQLEKLHKNQDIEDCTYDICSWVLQTFV